MTEPLTPQPQAPAAIRHLQRCVRSEVDIDGFYGRMRPASEPHRPCTVRQPAPAPSGYGPVAARWRYTETNNETPMELNQGDTVTLRTGGPRMTVTKVIGHHTTRLEEIAYHRLGYSEGDAVCEWTDAEGPQTGVFEAEALQPCPDA